MDEEKKQDAAQKAQSAREQGAQVQYDMPDEKALAQDHPVSTSDANTDQKNKENSS